MDTLVARLEDTLSSDQATRDAAEQYLAHETLPKSRTDDVLGVQLAQILSEASLSLYVRQAAAIALKKYVRKRWSIFFDTFTQDMVVNGIVQTVDATPVEAKEHIRTSLLACLCDAEPKVRSQASDILSLISSCDFPDHFPQLLPTLQAYLHSYAEQDAHAAYKVHGAMKFLLDLVHVELDENQLLMVAQQLVPLLQGIVSSSSDWITPHTRARCINVFHQCLISLYMAKDSYVDTVHMVTTHYLPPWLQGMQVLMSPDFFNSANWQEPVTWEMLGLRHEIVAFLGTASHFRNIFQEYAPTLLRLVIAQLQAMVPLFIECHMLDNISFPSSVEADADVACSVSMLAESCFTFLTRQSRAAAMRDVCVQGGVGGDGAATDTLHTLLVLMRTYAQVTNEDIETWEADLNAYVEQDDAENVLAGLRPAISDLLENMLDSFPLPVLRQLRVCVDGISTAQAHAKDAWWVPIEAQLWLIGASHEAVDDILLDRDDADLLSIPRMLELLVLPHLSMQAPIYLCGRCFVFASQYVQALPQDVARRIFVAAVDVVRMPDVSLPLKLSAVRAICNIKMDRAEATGSDDAAVLEHFTTLLPVATHSTLVLLLDTLEAFIPRDKSSSLSLDVLQRMTEAILLSWRHHMSDPAIELSISYVLESLLKCPVPGCPAQTLYMSMQAFAPCLSVDVELGVAPSAAAMIRSVFRVADVEMLRGVVSFAFPAVASYMLVGEDIEALQSLMQSLAILCEKCPHDILGWHDEHDTPSLQILLRIIERLLCMDEQVCGQAFGKFLVALFAQAGSTLAPVMPALLHALVAKLAQATMPDCTLTLLYALAYLMAHHAEAVVAQLDATELDGGESALVTFVRRWLADVLYTTTPDMLQEHMTALMQLFQHWTPSLQHLFVDGDVLPAPDHVIMTRSRAKANQQYEQIPASTKVLKLLLQEYATSRKLLDEAHARDVQAKAPLEEQLDHDEWSDEDDVDLGLDINWADFEDEEEEGDDVMDEADVREALRAVGIADVPSGIRTCRDVDRVRRTHCLAQFLRSLDARVPYVGEAVSHLNATEMACLSSL